MKNIAIVIPCYNESKRLDPLAITAFARSHPSVIFIMVDDGSTDNTLEIIERMRENLDGQVTCVSLGSNSKKAEAVRQGFLAAFKMPVEHIGYWDADLATPLYHIDEMAAAFDDPLIEIVMGSRVRLLGRNIRRGLFRHFSGRVYATFASMVLRMLAYDTQCGAKLFRNTEQTQKIFSFPFTTKWVFDVEILARAIVYNREKKTGCDPNLFCVEYPLHEWIDKKGSKRKAVDYFFSVLDLIKVYGILTFKKKGSEYINRLAGE
ncbi:MAG: glycosyltransferase [Candidatus Omnitrophica bacterium]|nr:glycosyltransferase [Candidatus Omnitrophota bacterium]